MPFLSGKDEVVVGNSSFAFADLSAGWEGFMDAALLTQMGIVFSMAVILGAALAYHPRTRSKASTLEELELPNTLIMYSLVGAVTALIVQVNQAMALVVFGIGGLMRFRTDVGPAKHTGRVILAAVVGICCGLKMPVVAIFATGFGWLLLWYLERREYASIQIKGLDRDTLPRAAEAYRALLTSSGCRVIGEKKDFVKGTVTFVFGIPPKADRTSLGDRFIQAIAPDIRGAVDWL